MKQFALLRHAKSSWDQPGLNDFDRPLNERGWKAARRMGRELHRRGIRFDQVLASAAARVRETIDGVEEKYDFRAPVRFEPRIYMADVDTLLDLVRGIDDEASAALLVGHNPGLEQLAIALSHEDERGLRHRIRGKFPTAALALIQLPVENWADIVPGDGEIVALIVPKDLD